MANTQPTTDPKDTTDRALTYTSSGRLLHISLPFINDLISLLSTLSSSFEEELARISNEQREAEHVDKHDPKEKLMLVVSAECEEYLRETMRQLYAKEEDKYDILVKKHPGTETIAGMVDPRDSEAMVLAPVLNMY